MRRPEDMFKSPLRGMKVTIKTDYHLIPDAKNREDLIVELKCYAQDGVITPYSESSLTPQENYGIKQVTFPEEVTGELIAYLFKGTIVTFEGNGFNGEEMLTNKGVDFERIPAGSGVPFFSNDAGKQLEQMITLREVTGKRHYCQLFHERDFESIEAAYMIEVKGEKLIDESLVSKFYLSDYL